MQVFSFPSKQKASKSWADNEFMFLTLNWKKICGVLIDGVSDFLVEIPDFDRK